MVLDNASGQMPTIALLTGLRTNNMVLENIDIMMDHITLANGKMLRKKGKERRCGLLELNKRACGPMEIFLLKVKST
jgi:hypothetical protein